ncbi:TetR/AcrR family transcriptional regulator [Sphingosinicella soli]|uniref:AcrR family transcriptional regulator n=1 Tax=Sphingosinicella soli TaxID=333708 RepID=A0A7W7AYW6_9SPHN|nr:TetR/AcrR family transcriptional regulator [Sphingosinicella soli]MBB4630911.1 AcrR family transcriptional regulator [Sphingosinicella soli]
MEAAKVCFVRSGFALTKVADIAAEAGVSVGLVYRFFPSKEALVEAIVAADAQRQLYRLSSVLADHPATVGSAIKHFLGDLRSMLLDRNRTALMTEIAAETMRNEKVRQVLMSQDKASENLEGKLKILSNGPEDPSNLELRLRLVSALASGAAIEIAMRPELRSSSFLDLLDEAAEHILSAA